MKALIDKYSTWFVLALLLVLGISTYLLWVRSKGTNFARYAYSPEDQKAFEKILSWVKIHNPNEYSWWRNDIYLYMPGGPRDNMYGIEVADMPDGTTSLSKRALVAMSELKYPLPEGYAYGIYQATQQFYNDFLKTV